MTSRTCFFAAFTLVLSAVNIEALRALVEVAANDPTSSHIVAVPFVALALIVLSRETIFSTAETGLAVGLLAILAGAGLSLAGSGPYADIGTNALSLQITGFLVCWTGGFVLAYGPNACRRAAFPLVFLLFMIPPPAIAIDATTQFLKSGSSAAVAGLFTLVGTPFHRDGNVFSLPGLVIEIADECSGIRSSIALLLTGLLAGHMFLRKRWTRAALLLAIIPVALIKNGVRIVSLSLLSLHVDPAFLTGQLHHDGGVVFFLLALGLMMPLFALLRWSETRRSPSVTAI
jgi:exosortase